MTKGELLKFAVTYWAQLLALGSLPLAALKIILDRRTKRDELRYSGLVTIRNTEIRNYSQTVGEIFGKISTVVFFLDNGKDGIKTMQSELITLHGSLYKSHTTLSFFVPDKDSKVLDEYNELIGSICINLITLFDKVAKGKTDTDEFKTDFKKFQNEFDGIADKFDKLGPEIQKMVRSYNRV